MTEEKEFVGILVTFDEKNEAVVNMNGVNAQQILVAAGLLDEMARYMLRTAFANSARQQAEDQARRAQALAMMAQVRKDIERARPTG